MTNMTSSSNLSAIREPELTSFDICPQMQVQKHVSSHVHQAFSVARSSRRFLLRSCLNVTMAQDLGAKLGTLKIFPAIFSPSKGTIQIRYLPNSSHLVKVHFLGVGLYTRPATRQHTWTNLSWARNQQFLGALPCLNRDGFHWWFFFWLPLKHIEDVYVFSPLKNEHTWQVGKLYNKSWDFFKPWFPGTVSFWHMFVEKYMNTQNTNNFASHSDSNFLNSHSHHLDLWTPNGAAWSVDRNLPNSSQLFVRFMLFWLLVKSWIYVEQNLKQAKTRKSHQRKYDNLRTLLLIVQKSCKQHATWNWTKKTVKNGMTLKLARLGWNRFPKSLQSYKKTSLSDFEVGSYVLSNRRTWGC